MNCVIFTFIFYGIYLVPTTDACADRTPLGMANGLITADQISNSSMYADYLPSRGRLYSSSSWCGSVGMIDGKSHWFQVVFNSQTTINGIAIQGGALVARYFIKEFRLDYSINGMKWNPFQNGKRFKGNVDNLNVVYNWFTTSMVATHIRLYPTTSNNDLPCLRIELYGCLDNNIPLQLGMSSGIIKNTQLKSNNGIIEAASRLFNFDDGMHRMNDNIPMYLQIDFQKAKTVTGISMQGSFEGWIKKFIKKYNIKYSNDSKTFTLLNQNLGNTDLGAVFIPFLEPTTMKYIRITAIDCTSTCGMKVEIYGYDPVCFQTLTQMNIYRRNGAIVPNVDINSPGAWCATDNADFVRITFTKPIIISGIILQGDSNRDGWVKKYKVQYGATKYELIEELVGVPARISPLSVNWLNPYIVTNFLHIIPTLCNNGRCCLRFRLKGCQFVLEEPHTIQGSISSSTITFTWKAPISHPLPVDKYHIRISASKEYENKHKFSFSTINTTTTHLSYNVSDINFSAARIQVNITADIQGVKKSAKPYDFYVQPKDPPSPGLTKNFSFNETHNATIVTLTTSSDENGPISYYEIVISTTRKTNLPNQLKNQAESELKNLDYFLASQINAEDLPTDGLQYSFVEGQEYIDSLNARISTVGKYYLYARAVIDGNDITKYGFSKMNYFSILSQEIMLERNSLSVIIPRILNDAIPSVRLVKGSSNIEYHFVVIMKVNKTTLQEKEPTLYKQKELKTYETADYNEPYIAGVFNKAQLLNVDEFKLGDNVTYSMPSSSARKRRSVLEYRNGPLIVGETYVVFQRLLVQDEFYSTAWSKEFVVPMQAENGKEKVAPQPPSSSSKLSLIIGICVSSVIVIVIIGAIIYKRKVATSRTKSTESEGEKSAGGSNYQDLTGIHQSVYKDTYEELQNVAKSGPTYEQIAMKKVQHKQMDTSQFSKYFIRQSSSNYEGLNKEINSLVQNNDYRNSNSKAATNDVIEIISSKDRCVGYSIFQGGNLRNAFDIWRKIFLEAFPVVVVIRTCGTLRSDKLLNCLVGETEKYGDYNVRLCQTLVRKDHTTQEVEISYGQHKHKFYLYEFEVLPLMEYVASTEYLMNTCRAFNRMVQTKQNTRISFIDNSGYGFDIILIVIIEMMVLIKEKGTVDIYNFLTMLVSKVSSLKVTLEQYLIIHKVIWEFIAYGKKYVPVEDFQNEYNNFKKEKDDKGRYFFEREFHEQDKLRKSLTNTCIPASSYKKRVVSPVSPDYINAVYVDSYQKRNAFIATQAPLKETVLDFWDMVLKENVSTIIMLHTLNEDRTTDYPVFWKLPEDNSKDIKVKLVSDSMHGVVMLRSFFVSVKAETHPVNIIQLTNWSVNNLPKIEDMKLTVEELKKSQERLDHGTIVVTCGDGAYRSGTFIACMNALEQIKVEEGVDVFNIVRCMRQSRPEFILNEHQYRFVYEVVNSFMENHSAYEYINT
ncbi:uncharacterized protein LOC130655622 isoform X1 [Hydractinia symbiolongicarpus]|uniref:uncharacterized protein LOC130655622 isoform X1 n=2 Tax=Hydractinia symbiolongicarpus TaxID=13093 RepID=UPI002551A880|nr:uncharacterized protein LOC130655622 isoform X1 [Hydractinia symbiolongicarpus]